MKSMSKRNAATPHPPNLHAMEVVTMNLDEILCGDALTVLAGFPDACVDMCVTSPPYYGLRKYLEDDAPNKEYEIGLEASPEIYVAKLVAVFREVKRVLKPEGTCWINLGDSYTGSGSGGGGSFDAERPGWQTIKGKRNAKRWGGGNLPATGDLKPKDLIGIPWMVAFALRADGWYLRSDIIWSKPNPMPESVTDRPTKSHEHIFLLSKSSTYFYDAEAIAEPLKYPDETRRPVGSKGAWELDGRAQHENGGGKPYDGYPSSRNKRSVWTITTRPFSGVHFATFPPDLIEPCILAGSKAGGLVLDPFMGSGTVAQVAIDKGRHYLGIELSPDYVELARKRILSTNVPLFI
jgi:DNA modification methylase